MLEKFKYSREKNVGGALKKAAQRSMWIYTAILIIGGIIMMIFGMVDFEYLFGLFLGGIAAVILGPFLAYGTFFPMYVFGEFVENSTITAGKISLESAGTASASGSLYEGIKRNMEQSFSTKIKERDANRKKAELDCLKEQGLITEEEYLSRIEEVNVK